MSDAIHPLADPHLPPFITPPGETDVLMGVMIVFLIVMILIVGNLYLRLHALPERMAHRANKVQFEIVAVLALLALFTHNNLYWVAALLLALIRIPDFWTPLAIIAESQQKIASHLMPGSERRAGPVDALAPPTTPEADPARPPASEPREHPATEPRDGYALAHQDERV